MADTKSPEERSRNMAAIRSRNTKPEVLFRHWLFERGYRYRVNVDYIPGHPDIFLRKYNTAIFVHGCFWHRHKGCKYAYMPKSRADFWQDKFVRNIQRDEIVCNELGNDGIKVLIVWECSIKRWKKDRDSRDLVMTKIEAFLKSEDVSFSEL